MSRKRNPDNLFRKAERAFVADPNRESAFRLYVARKRAGDPEAGLKFYDFIYEQAQEDSELDFADPSSRVYLVENNIYCGECGFEEAFEAAELPDRFFPEHMDHPDIGDIEMDATHEYIDNLYGHFSLLKAFQKIEKYGPSELREIINLNEEILCNSCEAILKLDTYPVPWQEVLD